MTMTKKLAVALAICFVVCIAPNTASAQFWTATAASTGEDDPVAIVNRPAVKFGGLRDQIDIYSIGNDAVNDRSIYVTSINYGCRRHGCAYFLGPTVNLGGVSGLFPSAIGWGNHREVFMFGSDARLWHNWSNDNMSWSGWYSLGGPAGSWPTGGFCSAPSAVSWAPERIDVFEVSCSDRRVWHIWYSGGWSNWEITPTSGTVLGTPQAVSNGPGRLDVLVTDYASQNVVDLQYDGHWQSYDTGLSADCGYPAVATQATGVAAFVRACDDQHLLGAAFYNGQWNAVQSIAATSFDSSVAVQSGSAAVHVVYADASGVGYVHSQNWLNTYFASGFGYVPEWIGTSANDTFAFVLGAVPSVDGTPGLSPPMYVVAQKPDHSIWYSYVPY
jgi:hypothetical protein